MANLLRALIAASICVSTYGLDTRTDRDIELPVVDVGYGIYQASLNVGNDIKDEQIY
jgi:hypothetical protein